MSTSVSARRWHPAHLLAVLALFAASFATAAGVNPAPAQAATCPCTIWPGTYVPGTQAVSSSSSVELGVKFRADQDGVIKGVRFYKGTGNTGTHIGRLWSRTGTKLAEATFTGETGSGWQQVMFAQPVAITANTTYVASYLAPVGHYAWEENEFASAGVTNPPLTALQSGVDGGNGVYVYGSGGFPTSTYNASSYAVDVVFDVTAADTSPPTVTSRTPAAGSSGVSTWTKVSATLSETVDSASIKAELATSAGAAVATTVAYDAATRTVVMTPKQQLDFNTGYTAKISGATDAAGNVMTPVSWTFTTSAVAGCPQTLWRDTDTPAVAATTSTSPTEVGVKFRADRDGYITGIRFYKGSGNTGTHIGRLWSSTGAKLAEATFSGESATGWQRVDFAAPVRISAGTVYVASYYAPVGRYSYTSNYFATAGWARPPLTALMNGAQGGNGVYLAGAGFPTATYQSTNYWVDPVFDPTASGACPATVWNDTQAPATAAVSSTSSIEVGVKFRADRDGYITGIRFYKGTGNTGTHIGRLWSRTGTKLAEATFVAESGSGWQQAWFSQPVGISAGLTYVASYYAPVGRYAFTDSAFASSGVTRGPLTALQSGVDGGNGVYAYGTGGFPTSTYNASNYGVDVMFTMASGVACPCTVWPDDAVPGALSTTDTRATEVGVRFRAMLNGYVTGVRFYKGADNTGTHVGRLWSNSGTKLAEATFTGESANGWQQVSFSSPVAVQAGTTYVASYNAPNGRYAFDESYFAVQNAARGPLAATADGVGGANGVFTYGAAFPSTTYRSSNYWVDVVFDVTATDTTPPVVVAQSPAPGATNVPDTTNVTARFDEQVVGSSVSIGLAAGGTAVAGSTAYDSGTSTATFTPSAALAASTQYTVTVSGAKDNAGNVMQPVTWAFTTAAADTTPPTVTATSPASGATGVPVTSTVSATFSEPVQAGSITMTVKNPAGTAVAGSLAYDATARRATFTPSAVLATNTTYTATVSGATDPSGNVMSPSSWSFTTTASTYACPCTIWPSSATPAVAAEADSGSVEVGVRFRADVAGQVTGVRFYKGTGNTGTHVGRLWSNTGTLLASVTFTGETATGWQQATFAGPVSINANTTYVMSYYAPAGHYAVTEPGFGAAVDRAPLHALRDGQDGPNGVYRYGTGGVFPTSTYNSSNYWVDVVFTTNAADTTPPSVDAMTPAANATGVPVVTNVRARFTESVVASSVSMVLETAAGGAVAGTTTYDNASTTATFAPSAALAASTQYRVTVSGAQDNAGNVMQPVSWTFTTAAAVPAPPIGVITSTSNPYSTYYPEILRAEGLTEFSALTLDNMNAGALSQFDVVILGDVALTDAQASVLTSWVNGGGRLVAMHPDARLAALLGLSSAGTTLTNGYVAVDTSTTAGAGITSATMQFHGTADRYTLSGSTMIARLYSNATTSTSNPAVTTRDVGTAGGKAAAFTYDLARSVALTHQGNPAWAGQERDGQAPIRSDDMFYGGSSTDWVNLSKVSIPQADEQQRLLVNLVESFNRDVMPLPRFWYFPGGFNAVVIATGDDETPGTSGTAGRFDHYIANSTPGCSVADWACLRFTSYVWTSVALTDAQARSYDQQGFEVGLHPQNACVDFTPSSLETVYATQLAEWGQKYVSLPAPTTSRFHCIVYSDWDSQPKTELRHGIRFDANYYYWPGSWIQDRPGFMTGTGIPMRFTDTSGNLIDVYQGTTQMTDESGQSYPYTPNTLLDNALNANGYYGAFVANMHDSNKPTSYEDDQLVASAKNHGIPVIAARQMLRWLDGRNTSTFTNLAWSNNSLTFQVTQATGARNLTAMLPTAGVGGTTLSGLTRDGAAVSIVPVTIKGIEYAFFPAASGSYVATYAVRAAAVTAATVPAAGTDTATVTWNSTVPGTAEVSYGTSPTSLGRTTVAETARKHAVKLTGLKSGTTYYYRVTTRDARGQDLVWPGPTQVAMFTTAAADTVAPSISDLRVTPLPDSTVRVTWTTDEPSTSRVLYGDSATNLNQEGRDDTLVTSHIVVLAGLDAQRPFHLRVSSTDAAGNERSFPPGNGAPARFVTAQAGVADQTLVGFRTGTTSGQLVVQGTGLAELTLSAATQPGSAEPATGGFESQIFDAFQTVGWQHAMWGADLPGGAGLSVLVRTGDTPEPDATWSAWTSVGANGQLDVPRGRYLQYRVGLVAGQTGVPALSWIGFTHDGPLPGADRRSGKVVG